METTFVPISEPDEWERLRERSKAEPVLVFKHDPPCSISVVAYHQLARLGREVPTIDVARAKTLSLAVAEETGVRHESPQVIVLRNGEAAWSASHYAITADAVAEALSEPA